MTLCINDRTHSITPAKELSPFPYNLYNFIYIIYFYIDFGVECRWGLVWRSGRESNGGGGSSVMLLRYLRYNK